MEHDKEQQRLEEMQAALSEQHRKDAERVKFRKEEYGRKRQELIERNEIEEREEHEREERLQALAERVRPHVEIDHARVLQPTKVRSHLNKYCFFFVDHNDVYIIGI